MEGKNKQIADHHQAPSSAWPKNSINDASSFSLMSPANLPLPPTSSLHSWQKPYYMNQHVGSGGPSSSTTKPKTSNFIQGSDPFRSISGENNKKADQNPFPAPSGHQNLTLENPAGGDNSSNKTVEVGNAPGKGRRPGPPGRTLDPDMDPRKMKRIVSNRLSAQRSRIKKLQHLTDMERKAESLETLVAVLSPQVELYKNKKHLLEMEQRNLNLRITACESRKILVEAQIQERKAEVARLRELYLRQQQQRMQAQPGWGNVWGHGVSNQQMMNPVLNQPGFGQSTMYFNPNQADPAGENMAEINMLNQLSLNQQQERPERIHMPGWEPSPGGQLTNNYVGLNQSGPGMVQNMPTFNQFPNPLQKGSLDSNSNFGGLEEILEKYKDSKSIQ